MILVWPGVADAVHTPLLYHLQEDEAGRRFHSVLVVNDRLQLDQQLGETVSSFIAGEMSDVICCE